MTPSFSPSFLTESPSQYLNIPVRDGLTSQSGIPWMLLVGIIVIIIVIYLIMRGAASRNSDSSDDEGRACQCKPCNCNCARSSFENAAPYDASA